MPYPASTLSLQKGKYYIVVTIPEELRPHLKGRKQIKRSTGTSDIQIAQRIQHDKTIELYAQLDQAAQLENPIYRTVKGLLETLGYDSVKYLEDQDLNNPLVLEDILFQFRGDINRMMYGGDTFNNVEAQSMHIAQLKIEPAISKITNFVDGRIAEIDSRTQKAFSVAANDFVVNKKWGREKTKVSARKAIGEFTKYMGDLHLSEIIKKTGYDYAKRLSEENLANKTIKNRIGYVSQVLTYCEREGWIGSNPFHGLNLSIYGKQSERYRSLTTNQLKDIFQQKMPNDVKLLLSILISTGMRLDEVATLEFSDIKIENGISFIDLTSDKKVIKNIGSARKVPIIPELKKKIGTGSGRLFPRFKIDADGKAQGAASKACMPYIRKVTDDPKIVLHSLRGTIKDLLRDTGTSKEINDFITGHSSGDVAGGYGSGPSLKVRYDALCSVDHPWLV